jgi:hypothetical protein
LDAASTTPSDSAANEYRLSPTTDDFVRVFYLAHAATPQRLRETALHVQSKSHNVWVFTYNAPSAIAVRGTAEEIALADRLIQEQDK